MEVAVFTSSGKSIQYDDGQFLVDGQPAGIERVIEYDRLGVLTWASIEMREWAHQVAAPAPQPAVAAVTEQVPAPVKGPGRAYRLGRWLRRTYGTPRNPRWRNVALTVGLLVAVIAVSGFAGRFMQRTTPFSWVTLQRPFGWAEWYLGTDADKGKVEYCEQRYADANYSLEDSMFAGSPGLHEISGLVPPRSLWVAPYRFTSKRPQVTEADVRESYALSKANSGDDEFSELRKSVVSGFPALTYEQFSPPSDSSPSGGGWIWTRVLIGGAAVEVGFWHTGGITAADRSMYGGVLDSMVLRDTPDLRALTGVPTGSAASEGGTSTDAVGPGPTPEATGEGSGGSGGDATGADLAAPQDGSDGASADVLSEHALTYARELGGKPHKGEALYFIIGASANPESFAQKKLDDAIPLFGDMQSYFIVQKSDNFDGMTPGWFVVIEAYRTEAQARENLDFARRGFEDGKNSPYIKRATVKTDDPIPVNYVDVNPTGN